MDASAPGPSEARCSDCYVQQLEASLGMAEAALRAKSMTLQLLMEELQSLQGLICHLTGTKTVTEAKDLGALSAQLEAASQEKASLKSQLDAEQQKRLAAEEEIEQTAEAAYELYLNMQMAWAGWSGSDQLGTPLHSNSSDSSSSSPLGTAGLSSPSLIQRQQQQQMPAGSALFDSPLPAAADDSSPPAVADRLGTMPSTQTAAPPAGEQQDTQAGGLVCHTPYQAAAATGGGEQVLLGERLCRTPVSSRAQQQQQQHALAGIMTPLESRVSRLSAKLLGMVDKWQERIDKAGLGIPSSPLVQQQEQQQQLLLEQADGGTGSTHSPSFTASSRRIRSRSSSACRLSRFSLEDAAADEGPTKDQQQHQHASAVASKQALPGFMEQAGHAVN